MLALTRPCKQSWDKVPGTVAEGAANRFHKVLTFVFWTEPVPGFNLDYGGKRVAIATDAANEEERERRPWTALAGRPW